MIKPLAKLLFLLKPKRRWAQFSLGSLFVLMTVLCVWLGKQVNRARRQRETTLAIRNAGGVVRYDWSRQRSSASQMPPDAPPGPPWLHRQLGDEYFQSVEEVHMRRKVDAESPLPDLEGLNDLEAISLWRAQTTSDKDRKRMLRLLIEDITVERRPESLTAILHIRWSGGACQDLEVQLPAKVADRLRYSTETVELVRQLAADYADIEIAARLNEAGRRSVQGKAFSASMVSWIRYKHRIPAPAKRRPGELTVQQVAEQFGVSRHVVYYWIDRCMLSIRQERPNHPYWITLSSEQELELARWVRESSRIK